MGIIAAASCLTLACGSAAERRKVLAFFFDGVEAEEGAKVDAPPADGAVDTHIDRGARPLPRPTGSQHAPFANRLCYVCHPGSRVGGLAVRGPDVCLDCHELADYVDVYTHAPLESEGCVLCHDPHESGQPHLVRGPEAKLCGRCHDASDAQFVSWHARVPADVRCTRCHDPHGAPTPQLLMRLDAPRCGSCHPREVDPTLATHAPINAGTCTPCHTGDHAGAPPYLTDIPDALCSYCHDTTSLSGGDHHIPGKTQGCTSCHDPHGPSPADRRELRGAGVERAWGQAHDGRR